MYVRTKWLSYLQKVLYNNQHSTKLRLQEFLYLPGPQLFYSGDREIDLKIRKLKGMLSVAETKILTPDSG